MKTRLVVIFLTIFALSCKKDAGVDNGNTQSLPTVTTASVGPVFNTSATSGGNIGADGGSGVTARGVCWGTTANPAITGNHSTDGTGTGNFTSSLTGLSASTTYHVRAYATNSAGTAYGSDISFTTTAGSFPDIYVSGYEKSGTSPVAKIWKNGVATSLTGGGPSSAYAASIFVSGSDVYAAGNEIVAGMSSALFWKNGTLTVLSNGTGQAFAYSVFVSGTDVYVAGEEVTGTPARSTATIWKNNVPTRLSGFTANAVYVLGSDVYATGAEASGAYSDAVYWKNGTQTKLSTSPYGSFGYSVFVSGTDVYVAGYESNSSTTSVAMLWKNGIAVPLTAGATRAEAKSVYVSGTDVYVVGFEYNATNRVAKIWKNGVPTTLSSAGNDAMAAAVFVVGTDVYVTGQEKIAGKYLAQFWKNGIVRSINDGANDAGCGGIFVR